MARQYKVIKHKMESIDNKLRHSQLHMLHQVHQSGEQDYSPMEEAFKIEMNAASSDYIENVEKIKEEFATA